MGTSLKTRLGPWFSLRALGWSACIVVAAVIGVQFYGIWLRHQAVARIRELGGDVDLDNAGFEPRFLALFLSPPVRCVWLKGVQARPADFQYLAGLKHVERLDLSGTRIDSVGMRLLGSMSQLQTLNLNGTGTDDSGIQHLRKLKYIKTLSIAHNRVSDVGLKCLSQMTQMENLDVAFCPISGNGLAIVQSFPRLRALEMDDQQVTAGSAKLLQGSPIGRIVVLVHEGTGRAAHALLSSPGTPEAIGLSHPDRRILWDSKRPWGKTLPGRCEVIQQQLSLDASQADALVEIIRKSPLNWEVMPGNVTNWNVPAKGDPEAIQSFADFVAAVNLVGTDAVKGAVAYKNLTLFIASQRAKQIVPDLLKALGEIKHDYSNRQFFNFAVAVLVRHGLPDPLVVHQLQAILHNHPDHHARALTVATFGAHFGERFGKDDEQLPGDNEARIATKLLIPVLDDEYGECRVQAAFILSRIAAPDPQFADIVAKAIICQLQDPEMSIWWYTTQSAWKRLVYAQPRVVESNLDSLRQAIKSAPEVAVTANLIEAIGTAAHVSQAAADEITELCLSLFRNPETRLNAAEFALQFNGQWQRFPGGPNALYQSAALRSVRELADKNPEAMRRIVVELLAIYSVNKGMQPVIQYFITELIRRQQESEKAP
jgi:hypothetical protein